MHAAPLLQYALSLLQHTVTAAEFCWLSSVLMPHVFLSQPLHGI
jgi:hypothetical protein